MPKPTNRTLAPLQQTATEFSHALGAAMNEAHNLHPNQVDGMHTFLSRIQMQLDAAASRLNQMNQANQASKKTEPDQSVLLTTQSPCGSH